MSAKSVACIEAGSEAPCTEDARILTSEPCAEAQPSVEVADLKEGYGVMVEEVQLVAISCEFVGLTVISPAVVKSAEDGEGFTAVLQSKAGFGIEIMIKDLVLWRYQG